MSIGISGVTAMAGASASTQKTKLAAGQFESLLIAQMLRSMRESESGWLGTGEDSAADSAMAMAEEHFASAISAAGGLGLAKIVNSGLESPAVTRGVHLGGGKAGGGAGS